MCKRILACLLACVLLWQCGCTRAPEPEETPINEPSIQSHTERMTKAAQWDVSDIYQNMAAFEADMKAVRETLLPKLERVTGTLDNTDAVVDYLQLLYELEERLEKLYHYAYLQCEKNQADSQATELLLRVETLKLAFANINAGLEEELCAQSDALWDALKQAPKLTQDYARLERMRTSQTDTLSAREQVLLLPLHAAITGAKSLFSKLKAVDMVFPTLTDLDGKAIIANENQYALVMRTIKDRTFRKRFAQAFFGAYGQMRNTLAQNMNNFVQAQVALYRAYGYKTVLDAMLEQHMVPAEAYENLMRAAKEQLPLYQRGIRLRKRILNVKTLYPSDLLVSLPSFEPNQISFEQAKQILSNALQVLGEPYVSDLESAFDAQWIDVYPAPAKRSGAFSAQVYGVHPYVLLNYQEDIDSVLTLAHEMGHAMHQYYSANAQKTAYAGNPTSFSSEVTSIVNELLLHRYLQNHASTEQERMYYLAKELNLFNNTFFTQCMYAQFEQDVYSVVESGGALSAERLETLWLETAERFYGAEVVLPDGYQYAWSRIPHFYYGYYVYQYAFALGVACIVTEQLEVPGAREAYQMYLEAGSSMDASALFKLLGVDINDQSLFQTAFARYETLLTQVSNLLP